jgi:protein-tyrosine kinase
VATINVDEQEEALMQQVIADSGEAVADKWLRANPGGRALQTAEEPPQDWLFAGGDELFRGIYTRAGAGFAAEVLGVCSALVGEGKTTVSVGLAVAIAQDFPERRVLLVETDIQRPVLSEDFGIPASPGLLDCLVGDEPLLLACRPTFLENLHIVPAGTLPRVPGRPLRSSRMAAIIDSMRDSYDVVILDIPALLANSDAILLTDLVDGVVCVVRGGVTSVTAMNRALEQVDQAKLRGVVINAAESSVPGWVRRLGGL